MNAMADITIERLEDQIGWYDRQSARAQKYFKGLKITEITAGALVPLFAGIGAAPWLTGLMGVLIVVLEGVQHLNQYHHNWITYRSTCEELKHEKYLYLAKAGPYISAVDAHALLAERIEGLVSQEHAKWIATQERLPKERSRGPDVS